MRLHTVPRRKGRQRLNGHDREHDGAAAVEDPV